MLQHREALCPISTTVANRLDEVEKPAGHAISTTWSFLFCQGQQTKTNGSLVFYQGVGIGACEMMMRNYKCTDTNLVFISVRLYNPDFQYTHLAQCLSNHFSFPYHFSGTVPRHCLPVRVPGRTATLLFTRLRKISRLRRPII